MIGGAIALGSAIYTSYRLGFIAAEKYADDLYGKVWASHMSFPNNINQIHILITLCAVVGVLGIWIKKNAGVILSCGSYTGVIATFLWWYKISEDFLRDVEIPHFTSEIAHIGPLKDAVWWDIIVLITAVCLVTWLLAILLKIRYWHTS